MKSFLIGICTLAILLAFGLVTHNWGRADHWMLIVGGVACALALIFTGGVGRAGRIPTDRSERKTFWKVAFIMFMIGFPNLIVAVILFYATHPGPKGVLD